MYSVVGGAGRLSRLLKETKQRQILMEAVTADIPDPEQLSISRSWASLSGTNDLLSGGISRQVNDVWKLPLEPYRNMKLWLKFDSGLKLRDWSYNGNTTRLKSKTVQMPTKQLARDDGISEGQIYGIFDGQNQWVEVEDSPTVRFQDLMIANNEVTLTVFMSPFGGISLDAEGYGDLFYKIDSDEVRYAYRARIKADGALGFTVIDNYAVYNLESPPDVVPHYETGDFDLEDFDEEDYNLTGDVAAQVDANIQPTDWTIYTFTYNTVTKSMKICSAWQDTDPDNPTNRVVQVEAQSTSLPNLTNLSMFLPLNEGNGTVVHDSSGNNINGTFDDGVNAPVWENGLLKFSGTAKAIRYPNHSAITNLSSFTIAFKIKLLSYATDASTDWILQKDYREASGYPNGGGFLFYIPGNGSNALVVDFWNPAGDYQTIFVPNALPALNTWYDVIFTYDGTNYSVRVGALSPVSFTRAGDTITTTDGGMIGDTVGSFQGYISDLIIQKRVWVTADRNYFAALVPGYRGGFPTWRPLPEAEPLDPVPITRPITKIYDVPQPAATTTEFKLNNPASATPFVPFYNVAGGTPITDPELLKYDVADGTTTTSSVGFTSVYSLTGQSSTADLVDTDNDIGYGQVIRTTGSNLYLKKLGKISIAGIKRASDGGGTIQLGIIKAAGAFIAFGPTINVSSQLNTSTWVTFEGTNAANADPTTGYALAVGDGVGLKWTSPSGTIYVQRGGSNFYESNTLSCQATFRTDNAWHITNSSYAVAGDFFTGGYTTGVPAEHNMNNTAENANCTLGLWQTNSPLEGIIPTRWILRARKVGTLTSAVLRAFLVNASNVPVAELGTLACSTIGSTLQNIEFIFRSNIQGWTDGYRMCLQYSVTTGVNSTNYIVLNFLAGGSVGGTTLRAQKYKSVGGWFDVGTAGTDWAGKIYTGGNPFDPWIPLDNFRTRFAELISSSTAGTFGLNKVLTKGTVNLKKFGNPVGSIKLILYDGNWNPVATGFTQVDAGSLTTTGTAYDFTWVFNAYSMPIYTFWAIQYDSGTATDYVLVQCNSNTGAGASGQGSQVIAAEWYGGAFHNRADLDLAGIFYEGGVPDLTSRNRVAIFVVTEASILKSKKATEASFYFKIFGTVTGNIDIRSRRGSDDTPRDLIGTISTVGLNSTTWQKKTVINRNALHFLGVSDKICIEYSGGDQNNYVRVMMNPTDTFDGDDTQMSEFNSVTWSEPVDNLEIVGELWTGGDTYTPPPGTPFIPTPSAYNHNLFICAGGPLTAGNTGSPVCFTGMRIRDFRIVAGDTSYSSLTSLENWIINRHTILPILKGQVALAAYTTVSSS